ncbi:MAG TPA: AbrB/MazE/SpoVT family DNA-binding domain-containing protein [Nevskiaceae bacterium]|nr:AbrB/MazE/SpoVT family DNA-binding domain-containing protein [Nevskiaceae bacterium]
MTVLTITSKGQVTFKKGLLEHLDARPGDRLRVELLPGGRLAVQALPRTAVDGVFGLLAGKTRKKATLEQIDAVVADGWAGRSR